MSKLISVSDEVYEDLSRRKTPGKSFSMVIKGFIEGKKPVDIMQFAGILSKKEADETEAIARDMRKMAGATA